MSAVCFSLRIFAAAALAALLVSAASAEKAHYLERMEITGSFQGGGQDTVYSKIWVGEEKFRSETGDEIIIARLDKGVFWMISARDKTYSEVDVDMMRQLSGMAMMMLGVLTDEKGNILVPDDLYVKTGREKKVGEWSTYEIALNDKYAGDGFVQKLSMWVSPDINAPKNLYSNMMRMFIGGFKGEGKKLIKFWEEMDGFPVLTEIESMMMNSTTLIMKVDAVDISPRLYELPEGYKQVESPFQGLEGADAPDIRQFRNKR